MVVTLNKKQNIEKETENILQAIYGSIDCVELPIDLNYVLKFTGLELIRFTPNDPNLEHKELFQDVLGAYSRTGKAIFIRDGQIPSREAFTIAHEIGHHILHEDIHFRTDNFNYIDEEIEKEQEANYFAASLLMPDCLVKKYKVDYGGDLEKISLIFGVSKQAMQIRLSNLD
ncbi:MAG: ImmA/IrrE family metallo-endopeptidase [Candidatus Caenarcaniphilales bacterium]|nr:ImmA/IrrE family metallo-endopeptidase [Candidatus Caenarcaniphilales bacterium]